MANIYEDLKNIGVRLNEAGHIHKDDIDLAEPILLKYITSAPHSIPETEFDLENPSKNFQKYCELAKKKGVVVQHLGDYELVRYSSNIALIQPQNKHVSYLVKFQQRRLFGKKSVTQVLLWREQPNKFVADVKIEGLKLTAYVFFKLLFGENDCIITDGSQTEMGKRFWIDRIADAWNADFPVYYVNEKQTKKILLTPENFQKLRISEEIWGTKKQDSMYKKIAICKDYFWD